MAAAVEMAVCNWNRLLAGFWMIEPGVSTQGGAAKALEFIETFIFENHLKKTP